MFEDPKDKMTKNKLIEGMFNGFLAGILGGAIRIAHIFLILHRQQYNQ